MIYSKFGSKLTLLSKTESDGRVFVQASVEGTSDIHDYNVVDLKADDGMGEIHATVAKLPAKVFAKPQHNRRNLH